MAKPAGLPVGRFIKVNSVRVNKNGTIDVIVPDGQPKRRKKKVTKRKRRNPLAPRKRSAKPKRKTTKRRATKKRTAKRKK